MKKRSLSYLIATTTILLFIAPSRVVAAGTGVGNLPQGVQSDSAYAASFVSYGVTNVTATTQRTSCYTPEVPYAANTGPAEGYSGETPCENAATTGENLGPYPTQVGSNPGFPAATPMVVKDHSESDIRVDPSNPNHLIGSSKWFVSAEGYNHLLGFYESFDGGQSWPVQGHIPGYEGWTDNTDPVGAFDPYGNYYELILPYQFYYNADGTHNYQTNQNREPNPGQPAEVISMSVRPSGATSATDWITSHNGRPDFVATYPSKGREPDKQWIVIDTNPHSPHRGRIYAMWTLFDSYSAKPFVSYADANRDGTHTDWSAPQPLPTGPNSPQGDTYLLPHIAPDGTIYTTLTNTAPKKGYCCDTIFLDKSTDGGASWNFVGSVATDITAPPFTYHNTTFSDGIEDTFAVGGQTMNGHFPLYTSWEDYSAGYVNVILSASYDGGATWTAPIQVNDNSNPAIDEFQPNLTVASAGTVSVTFYDRRLTCPSAGSADALAAGIALDMSNPAYPGALPPYGAGNYCVNAGIQFYRPDLTPLGHNIRLTGHTWDPQLNAPVRYGGSDTTTFIGDYFGNTTAGSSDITSFVSTYDDGSNPGHQQQQIVATVNMR